ncbi:hypothetical protein TrVE_jg10133 [Triparma verrucosa]|uniref:Uncharacterized protein n=2 Tax=Triparma TaxID=722752 RepID=A0A9W6ZT63_9STRA|nr:hypothetical protein TrST_g3036 [Triparma strigata]GMH96439.1 hypothetical protein TrVE_jg10133 [Triparma verrucosa]|eukprot:CAMPEP_0182496356 /NCGR_PEP_ID=MMETSP1321-20130603/5019_1 /TAXON_ID=91990 /ORGANISM="Bolidomonas sp., Strain RCC1657" /LENGTH=78 /DNA_ID=CAMNT_0024699957 /DNA_START=71 /DNA_END=307 /DNA_ORIENTATION=-
MGGGGWFHVPEVWSPAGGWWATPKNWKVNTGLGFVAIGVACFCTFTISASKERRPIPPAWHIPSQRWAVHAKADDPSL